MDYESFCQDFFVSRETYAQLTSYHDLLIKWQQTINLISPKTINDIWQRHILDSCQFSERLVSRETIMIDIGSGGGLPAIILAILGYGPIYLVESDQRKAIFLQEVARELNLTNAIILAQRIEKISVPAVDVVTARACATLSTLLQWTYPLANPQTICLFAKGKNYAKEVEEAQQQWHFEWEAHPSRTDPQASLLQIKNITRR